MRAVNLARRPFENRRPVDRAALLLWIAFALFAAINLWLYWGHLTGVNETGDKLQAVRTAIGDEEARLDALGTEIGRLELGAQNVRTYFFNRLIARRTFPWSLLFERLETVLPDEVRLVNVRPDLLGDDETRGRRRATSRGRSANRLPRSAFDEPLYRAVSLDLQAVARDGEAMLAFIDRLYADSAFERPVLASEQRSQRGDVEFTLRVGFRTAVALREAAEGVTIDP
ncbi:MAG: hypothetical protein AAF772_13780, partial [Acidobacteriota bacterium]